ncbi:MAG: 2-hydroxyhepta-2,4-diene-1,7-dioate isomerase [Rhodobacteraceae bacterium]|nr:2-hydroxyhepta-2,4-diene-1,7-dioate isomerase [Paracoccaceae bacterium]
MKLFRHGEPGFEKVGVVAGEGSFRDASSLVDDITPASFAALKDVKTHVLPFVSTDTRIGACLADVPNFYCIGLNYRAHAVESGMAIPESPIIFSKATSCLAGPNDVLTLPSAGLKADWEVELGVVIARDTYRVSIDEALAYVAGYCLVNDLSERAAQLEGGGQWIRGKSLPGFGPIGPYFVSADEVPDPQSLRLWLSLNGEMMQDSTTADMIFSVAEIISDMSQYMRLRAGDLIATGTPSGVGMGQKPQRWLRDGDVLELGIDGLGTQKMEVSCG